MRSIFFIDYSNESNGYRLYNLETKKLMITRDVIFYKSSYWNWDESSMNMKVKNTSQGINFYPLSFREVSHTRKFTYQTNLYSTLQNLIFKLEQWQVKVESTGRKVKRLKSKDIFWYFLI